MTETKLNRPGNYDMPHIKGLTKCCGKDIYDGMAPCQPNMLKRYERKNTGVTIFAEFMRLNSSVCH